MMTPPERTPELLNAINTLLQSLEQVRDAGNDHVDALGNKVDALTKYVEALRAKMDAQDTVVDSIAKAHEAEIDVIRVLGEGITEFGGRVDTLGGKIDGLMNDVALVKGGHAVSAMRRNAALIADDLGCQLIEELPQGVVIGFAKVATDDGEPANEVDSFRHADLVLHVRDSRGHPGYIAVEASFTVNANDVRRAVRNAGYLHKYTGVASYAVVAGVEVMPEAQELIDQGEAHLYRIRPRDLQPE